MDKIQILKTFLEEDPSDLFTRFALALEYLKKNDLEAAKKWFEEILESDPEYVGVFYHLGKIYEQLGRHETASEIYKKGIKTAQKLHDHHAASELMAALSEND